MDTLSFSEFTKSKGFTTLVPKVRANKNGYPYLTLITADNKAENVYFSKKSSTLVKEGMEIVKGFLAGFQVAETINAEGEPRVKIISNSERVSIGDLL